ncbi:hypothetical protein PAMA_007331 [Pampus argenteus]
MPAFMSHYLEVKLQALKEYVGKWRTAETKAITRVSKRECAVIETQKSPPSATPGVALRFTAAGGINVGHLEEGCCGTRLGFSKLPEAAVRINHPAPIPGLYLQAKRTTEQITPTRDVIITHEAECSAAEEKLTTRAELPPRTDANSRSQKRGTAAGQREGEQDRKFSAAAKFTELR